MTDAARIARCSCGRVSATARGEPGFVVQCHCTKCQRGPEARSGSLHISDGRRTRRLRALCALWTQHKHHWVSLLPDIPAFLRAATEQS